MACEHCSPEPEIRVQYLERYNENEKVTVHMSDRTQWDIDMDDLIGPTMDGLTEWSLTARKIK